MQKTESKVMKGISLYVFVFAIIIIVVASILMYFYKNINTINTDLESNSEITMLNLYFLKYIKKDETRIKDYGLVDKEDLSSFYITFENREGNLNTFIKVEDILYFNKIKLCENVEEFIIELDNTLKETIDVRIKILGKIYELQYVIN